MKTNMQNEDIKVGQKLDVQFECNDAPVPTTVVRVEKRVIGQNIFVHIDGDAPGEMERVVRGINGQWYEFSAH